MNNKYLYIIVALLTTVALSVMSYKIYCLNFPLTPNSQNTLWQLETEMRFKANGSPVKVNLWLPKNTERFVVNDEDFFSGEYGLSILNKQQDRQASWSIREANGWQTLFYRALIEPVEIDLGTMDQSELRIDKPVFSELERNVASEVLAKATRLSADHESFVIQLFDAIGQRDSNGNLSVLLPNSRMESILPLMIRLLAWRDIPARVANGVLLKKDGNGQLRSWLQVYDGEQWQLFDQYTLQTAPQDEVLVIWTGLEPNIELSGGSALTVTQSLTGQDENMLEFFQLRKNEAKHWMIDYSFFSLPLSIQSDFRILLTIPIGVFLLVILRNLIGVQTFGTFMPVLIALSFRETGLQAGIIMFSMIVLLGLLTRLILDKLKLLLIPRVGSILIVVLLFMITISVLSYKLGIDIGLSVTLFPMVILAIMIERMSIVWDERGPLDVFKQGMGTLVVAAMAYYIMNIPIVQHIVFVFPELLLIILAGTMLMGRYTGFKLTELFRFRAFVDSEATRRV